jgi:hypothetical protein
MIGVDSCVFLIFTTRVDPNKGNEHRLRSILQRCPLKNESLSLRFSGSLRNTLETPLVSPLSTGPVALGTGSRREGGVALLK